MVIAPSDASRLLELAKKLKQTMQEREEYVKVQAEFSKLWSLCPPYFPSKMTEDELKNARNIEDRARQMLTWQLEIKDRLQPDAMLSSTKCCVSWRDKP